MKQECKLKEPEIINEGYDKVLAEWNNLLNGNTKWVYFQIPLAPHQQSIGAMIKIGICNVVKTLIIML